MESGVAVRGVAVLLCLSGLPVGAQVYRCQDGVGAISYSDQPCRGAEQRRLEVKTTAPNQPVVSPEPDTGPPAPAAPYRRPERVVVPPAPKTDLAGLTDALPKDAQGRPVLATTGPGGADLVLEKRKEPGPVNALARCSLLVTNCHLPGQRELDACFFSVPRCRTGEPWKEADACCPEACWQRYESARQRGQSPLAAFDGALFCRESCFPGLRSDVD